MSKAPVPIVEQAQRLAVSARTLPVDDAAKVLEQAITVLQAAQAQVLVDGERSGELAAASGCCTVRSFAMSILRRSAGDASAMAGVAVHLAAFPKLAAAHAAGAVHTPNLRTIIRHVPACGLDVLQGHEDALVELAAHAGPAEVGVFCQALAEVHHPERDQAKVRAAGLRSVRISPVGELAHLDAMLDPAVATRLKATLATTAKATRTPEGTRTHGERTADALEQLLRRGMDTEQATSTAAKPAHATVTVSLETLLGLPGHGQTLLSRFGLIPTTTAQRLTCDALVTLVVTHGDRVLNLGRTRRIVTGRQRTALAATYRTCAMPGCQVPFADCAIRHLWWWHLGGRTDHDLQIPLCGAHHRSLHDGDYSITRDHGTLTIRDPHGRTIPDPQQVLTAQPDLLTPPPSRATSRPAPTTNTPGAGPDNAPRPHPGTAHQSPEAGKPYNAISSQGSRPGTSRPKLSGSVPSSSADSTAMRCTATVRAKIDSGSPRSRSTTRVTGTPDRSAASPTSCTRSDQAPPPSRHTRWSFARRATEGPCRNCSTASPSLAT
jgi:hypothetical protein